VHARAAQRNGRSTGRDRDERALVPDGVEGRHANEPGVQRTMHPGRHDAAHRAAQVLGAGHGLVTRTITASVPVRVDYQLSPLGRTLLPVVRAIKDWSETHISEVHAARVAYDHATLAT
jgi:HxlR-like helix-turn-helix